MRDRFIIQPCNNIPLVTFYQVMTQMPEQFSAADLINKMSEVQGLKEEVIADLRLVLEKSLQCYSGSTLVAIAEAIDVAEKEAKSFYKSVKKGEIMD